jgi:hypothetical protein
MYCSREASICTGRRLGSGILATSTAVETARLHVLSEAQMALRGLMAVSAQ